MLRDRVRPSPHLLGRYAEELVAEYLRSRGWEVVRGSEAVELAILYIVSQTLSDVCRPGKPRAFIFPSRGLLKPSDWVVCHGGGTAFK